MVGGIIMNENLNLCKILKDCPKGTKLYSPIYGFMKLHSVEDESYSYPIFMADAEGCLHTFHPDGTMFLNTQAECCLFPSKEQREWKRNYKKPSFRLRLKSARQRKVRSATGAS